MEWLASIYECITVEFGLKTSLCHSFVSVTNNLMRTVLKLEKHTFFLPTWCIRSILKPRHLLGAPFSQLPLTFRKEPRTEPSTAHVTPSITGDKFKRISEGRNITNADASSQGNTEPLNGLVSLKMNHMLRLHSRKMPTPVGGLGSSAIIRTPNEGMWVHDRSPASTNT